MFSDYYFKDLIHEDVQLNGKRIIFYHRTHSKNVQSIMKNGFVVGNRSSYGNAIYGDLELSNQIEHQHMIDQYGDCIIEATTDISNFLILGDLAKQVYGNNWHPVDQVKLICGEDIYESEKGKWILTTMEGVDVSWSDTCGDAEDVVDDMNYINGVDMRKELPNLNKIKGMIIMGGCEGDTIVIHEPKDITPLRCVFSPIKGKYPTEWETVKDHK